MKFTLKTVILIALMAFYIVIILSNFSSLEGFESLDPIEETGEIGEIGEIGEPEEIEEPEETDLDKSSTPTKSKKQVTE